MRVFYEKRRGIIPALLAKNIDGLEPYAGTQFTCITSTKVQILRHHACAASQGHRLAQTIRRYSVYLLYWYKSINPSAPYLRC